MLDNARTIALNDIPVVAKEMLARSARLSTITAIPLEGGSTRLIYHYSLGPTAYDVEAVTLDNTVPSIAAITRAADWIEREIHDLYGVEFTGRAETTRLVRPPQLPVGFFREG